MYIQQLLIPFLKWAVLTEDTEVNERLSYIETFLLDPATGDNHIKIKFAYVVSLVRLNL